MQEVSSWPVHVVARCNTELEEEEKKKRGGGAAMIGLLALFLTSATAYNNGMGKVPALGWSSWYASPFGSEVTESFVKANAQAIKAAGLLQAGFSFINVDEGWLKGRYAENGTIFENFEKFPSGMRGLGDWLKAEGFS